MRPPLLRVRTQLAHLADEAENAANVAKLEFAFSRFHRARSPYLNGRCHFPRRADETQTKWAVATYQSATAGARAPKMPGLGAATFIGHNARGASDFRGTWT